MSHHEWDHNIFADLMVGLSKSDEDLGELFLHLYARSTASMYGLPVDSMLAVILANTSKIDTANPENTAWEKAIKKAAAGELAAAGRMVREALSVGAARRAVQNAADHFAGIGIARSNQTAEFGRARGAQIHSDARRNRQLVCDAAGRIMQDAGMENCPSVRDIAGDVSAATNLSNTAVRRHLGKGRLKRMFEVVQQLRSGPDD